jgi:hypothetical protein
MGVNMKKNYNFQEFNFDKYYYFLDTNKYFEVFKNISKEEYEMLNREYYRLDNSKISRYLFDNQEYFRKGQLLKFLVIDLEFVENTTKARIIDLITELFREIEIIELRNKTIIFYFEQTDIDFKNIFEAINDDFDLEIKIYESARLNINNPESFRIILDAYLDFCIDLSRLYTNNSNLIVDVANNDSNRLKLLKRAILYKVYEDSQLENLILSMFNNNLNVTKTAQDVYMHRNTINNKLELIKSETGLNIQNFNDAIAMYFLMKTK